MVFRVFTHLFFCARRRRTTEAAAIREEAENCKSKSDCVEEAGASLTKDLDEFADTLTDLGRDVNAMVQGATDIAGAVKDLKSATNVGQLGTEDVANDASDAAEDMANDASDAAEDAANDASDAAEDAADSVKDAAKHSIEELQGAVAKAQEEAEQAAKDVQECTCLLYTSPSPRD